MANTNCLPYYFKLQTANCNRCYDSIFKFKSMFKCCRNVFKVFLLLLSKLQYHDFTSALYVLINLTNFIMFNEKFVFLLFLVLCLFLSLTMRILEACITVERTYCPGTRRIILPLHSRWTSANYCSTSSVGWCRKAT